MFIPNFFKNVDLKDVREFISQNSFGIIISQVKGKMWGTHIPLYLKEKADGNFKLEGHISKGNPQGKFINFDQEVLVIFNGPHTYISSSWYDHLNVPTWNYVAVHVYGKLRTLNFEETHDHLVRLVDKYEKDSEKPVRVEDMPTDFVKKQISGLLAFEISMDEIEAAYKLSQNRDEKNHNEIVHQLETRDQGDDMKVAEYMKKHGHK
jgi:transcriptional regulator